MKETLTSLSEKTGFSVTTISRVLSGKAQKYRIGRETAETIRKVAKENNYFPNLLAQNLRTNKTDTIGLVLPSVSNPYFADIASIVIREAREREFTTIVLDCNENDNQERSAISSLMSRQIDGLIISPSGSDPSLLEEIAKDHVPVILIDRYFASSPLPYVTTDNFLGSRQAISYLISCGHRRITCIQGVTTSVPNSERIAGYRAALEKAGLNDNVEIVGNAFSVQNGYLETKLLLNRTERPTAIFALSNTIMLGALKAITESGLSVPRDISLIGFDSNIYMDFMTPAISRIEQPIEEMGVLATKLLFESITGGKRCSNQIKLAPHLVTRSSVANIH